MTLSDFYYSNGFDKSGYTDKGSTHDYINGYYNSEFSCKKEDKMNILEIGIGSGNSISLWNIFMKNSLIYGIDMLNYVSDINKSIFIEKNTKLIFGDAYNDSIINLFNDDYFDYIIDDGPHDFQSQVNCINKWMRKLKSNGKMIIEDIQSASESIQLRDISLLHPMIKTSTIIDLRLNKNRYDDIILELVKK